MNYQITIKSPLFQFNEIEKLVNILIKNNESNEDKITELNNKNKILCDIESCLLNKNVIFVPLQFERRIKEQIKHEIQSIENLLGKYYIQNIEDKSLSDQFILFIFNIGIFKIDIDNKLINNQVKNYKIMLNFLKVIDRLNLHINNIDILLEDINLQFGKNNSKITIKQVINSMEKQLNKI